MSALGNYIHLKAENYKDAGTFRLGEGKNKYQAISNFMESRLKEANIPSLSDATIQELKNRLANDSEAQQRRDKDGTAKQFQENLDKISDELYKVASTDAMGAFTMRKGQNKFQSLSSYYKNKDKGYSKEQIEAKIAKKNEINAMISAINKKGEASKDEIEAILKKYKELNLPKVSGKTKSTLGQIQEILNDTSYTTWQSHVSGAFGEQLVYSIRDVSDNNAMKAANDQIQKVVGNERGEIKISTNLISEDLAVDKILSKDEEGNFYTLGKTQNKVDVQIVVNNEDVFASVKMYQNFSRNNATLQSDIELLSPLTYLNSINDDFGNHWLNMHAGRLLSGRGNADDVLKQELAYEALVSGNPFKRPKINTNVFIAIEKETGRVFVQNVSTILTKRYNSIMLTPDITKLKFENVFDAGGFQNRITNILAQVHATKIHASMKIDFD